MVAASAARLSLDLPQDRHHRSISRGHHHRSSRSADAGRDQVHRRHWAGVGRQCVPIPVHHHRLRSGFMIQDLVGNAVPTFKETSSWTNNLIGSALSVVLWGYFLYVGVIDPFGGIWTLWPLFGTANQMLAAIALTLCTVVLFKMKRERFALVTIAPATWLVVCTTT